MSENFEVGQRWEYATRPEDVGSVLTIVRVDDINDEAIVHISLERVKIKSPRSADGFADHISHLPISDDALRTSVTKLIGSTSELPDFEEGYQIWKEAFDAGNGGFFTISVSECVAYMEQAINQ